MAKLVARLSLRTQPTRNGMIRNDLDKNRIRIGPGHAGVTGSQERVSPVDSLAGAAILLSNRVRQASRLAAVARIGRNPLIWAMVGSDAERIAACRQH